MMICEHCLIAENKITMVYKQTRLRIGGKEHSRILCEECLYDLARLIRDWCNPDNKSLQQVMNDLETKFREMQLKIPFAPITVDANNTPLTEWHYNCSCGANNLIGAPTSDHPNNGNIYKHLKRVHDLTEDEADALTKDARQVVFDRHAQYMKKNEAKEYAMRNHLYDGHRNVYPLRQRKTTRTPTKRIKTLEGRMARCRVWLDPNEPDEWQKFINHNHESLYVKPATGEDAERFDYIVVLRPEGDSPC